MISRPALALAFAAVAVCTLSGASQTTAPQQQPPRFKSSVEVTPVDVTVVDDHGQPIRDLTPADFTVRIDGNQRRVVSAEWISLVTAAKATAPVPVPEGYTSNENATGGRLIVIAVDEPNIRFGAARGIAGREGRLTGCRPRRLATACLRQSRQTRRCSTFVGNLPCRRRCGPCLDEGSDDRLEEGRQRIG